MVFSYKRKEYNNYLNILVMERASSKNVISSRSGITHRKSFKPQGTSIVRERITRFSRSNNREKYISEVISSRESAIRFLVSVGIIDNEGGLTSVYK